MEDHWPYLRHVVCNTFTPCIHSLYSFQNHSYFFISANFFLAALISPSSFFISAKVLFSVTSSFTFLFSKFFNADSASRNFCASTLAFSAALTFSFFAFSAAIFFSFSALFFCSLALCVVVILWYCNCAVCFERCGCISRNKPIRCLWWMSCMCYREGVGKFTNANFFVNWHAHISVIAI